MRAFRLARAKYSAFSGRGSLLASGRWHWAGVPIIYCAESRALSVLESFVHLRKDQIPSDYVSYEVEIDDTLIETLPEHRLPADWKAAVPVEARGIGSEWMQAKRSVALVVPSVVVPQERNVLFNAEHPDFSAIRISRPQPFEFGLEQDLTPEAARYLLSIKLPSSDEDRVEDLSAKARAGSLTEAESRELDGYLHIGSLVAVLQSKARRLLQQTPPSQ